MALSEQEELELLRLRKRKAMAQPSPPSRADYYLNQAKKAVSGTVALPGMAVDAVNSGMGLLESIANRIKRPITGPVEQTFPVEYPFMGSQNIREGADRLLGTEEIEAPSPWDEVGGLALEMGGPSIPFMARNLMTAPHKIPAAIAEAGSLAGGAVGGVIGEQAGEDMDAGFGTDFGGPLGEAIGVLLGSVAPVATPTLASKGIGLAASRVSPGARKVAAEREAGKVLGPAMQSELGVETNMSLADAVTGELRKHGDFNPTIGARTNAQVVQELESNVVGSTPERLARYAENKGRNQQTLDRAADDLMGAETARNLPRQAQARLGNAMTAINKRLEQLERQQGALAAATEGRTSQEMGEGIRDQYWKTRQDVKSKFSTAYDDLYAAADETGLNIDMDDVRTAAQKIAGADENVYQDMPRTFGKIRSQMGAEPELPYPKPANVLQKSANERAIEAAKDAGKKTTFREFHSLWKEVNNELGVAARSGDTRKYEYLKQLKSSLDDKLGQMEGGGLGDLSDEFRSLNQNYKTRYAKVFKEGVGGRVAAVGKFGATMDDAKVVERFFTPDGLDDFSAIYGNDQNANKLLRDGVLGLFAKSAVDEVSGKIKPGAAESFLRRNAEALKKMPELDSMLRDTVKTNEALIERAARLQQAQKAMDRSILKDVSKTEDVGALLRGAATSPKEMKRVFAIAKTPEQRAALARSFADELPRIAQTAKMEPYAYLMKNEESLRPIMERVGKKHWENLRTIAGGQTLQGRTQVPGSVGMKKGTDPLFEATGSNARSLVATYLSVLRGRTQPHSELSQIFARFGIKRREKMIDEIMNDAIYDPDLADSIAKIKKGRPDDVVANKFRNYLETAAFRTAIVAGDDDDAEGPREEPKQEDKKRPLGKIDGSMSKSDTPKRRATDAEMTGVRG